jgi:hypothetical protein
VLESPNSRILTVINPPITSQLRVAPEQIVEFVVFGKDLDCNADVKVTPGHNGICFEEMWQEIVDPKNYKRTPGRWSIMPRNEEFREIHYWFRLSKMGRVNLSALGMGDHQGGEILVRTLRKCYQVQLIVRKKNKEVAKIITTTTTEKVSQPTHYVATSQFQRQNYRPQYQPPQVGVVKLTEKPAVEIEEGCQWCLAEDYQHKSSIVLVGGGPENID